MDTGVVNFAVYENGTEYLGVAKITLPDRTNKTLTATGAGIPGDIDIPVPGHRDAMTVKIDFIDNPQAAYKLAEQRVHTIDCRAAHEEYDSTAGAIKIHAYKHIMKIIPKSQTGGTIAPVTAQAVGNEFSCLSIKSYIDGKCVEDFDPANFKDVDASGTDRLAAVRSAIGK